MEPQEVIWQFLSQIAFLAGLFAGIGLIVFSVWRGFKVPSFPNWWDASYLAAGMLLLIAAQFNQIEFQGVQLTRSPNTTLSEGQARNLVNLLKAANSDAAASLDGTTTEN